MITITSDSPGRIKVTFPYSAEIVAKIRTVKTRHWHSEGRYWSFPHSEPVLNEILSTFAGEEIDIDPSLRTQESQVSPLPNQLLDRFRHLIRLKHYSIRTEKTYLHWITRYLAFHDNRDPKDLTSQEIEAFLSHLAVNLKVSAGTQNVAFNALLFLYREVLRKELGDSINAIRAKKPKRLPTVMSKDETMRHHVHENVLQKAVRTAVSLAGIAKPVNVHTFRHCFATHLLEANYDIRTVQELMGHKDVSTTMIYTHVLNKPGITVKSPLDG